MLISSQLFLLPIEERLEPRADIPTKSFEILLLRRRPLGIIQELIAFLLISSTEFQLSSFCTLRSRQQRLLSLLNSIVVGTSDYYHSRRGCEEFFFGHKLSEDKFQTIWEDVSFLSYYMETFEEGKLYADELALSLFWLLRLFQFLVKYEQSGIFPSLRLSCTNFDAFTQET